jgi:hypothetical protein
VAVSNSVGTLAVSISTIRACNGNQEMKRIFRLSATLETYYSKFSITYYGHPVPGLMRCSDDRRGCRKMRLRLPIIYVADIDFKAIHEECESASEDMQSTSVGIVQETIHAIQDYER